MSQPIGRRAVLLGGAALLVPAAAGCSRTEGGAVVRAAGPGPVVATSAAPTPTASVTPSPPSTPTPTPTLAPGIGRADLEARIAEYLSGRTGTYRVAVHDRRSGVVATHESDLGETLSTVKLLIAIAVCRDAEEHGRWLTGEEQRLVSAMIQSSDNAATNALLARLGSGGVEEEIGDLGLMATSFRPFGAWWGYSTTVPEDLVLVVDALVDGRSGLGARSERYLLRLMERPAPNQQWGVASPPLPADLTVRTKNGWGPMADGYRTNSVGHVVGQGRDHTMAVLGRSPLGFGHGRRTVSGLAKLVNTALADPLV